MGNSSAKQTNKLLGQQQDLTRGYGDWAKGVSEEERARNRGLEDTITRGAGQLWGGLGSELGNISGDAGPGSFHDPYMSESQPFYKNAMQTGLFDQGQINDYRARAGLQNSAMFQGLQRQLNQGANVRGGGFAGYSGQRALLGRDTARQAEEARLGAEGSLQDMIRKNMFSGAQGVTGNDASYQGLLQNADAQRNQYSLANAGLGLQAAGLRNQTLGQGTGILGLLSQLRGNDLGYANLAGNEYGQGLNAINSRQQETPWWQTAIGAASGLAGIGLPFLTGGSKTGSQVQNIPTNNYNKYNFNQLAG